MWVCWRFAYGQKRHNNATSQTLPCERSGDKIPADLRFIWCNSAMVDNSSLTGECAPLKRSPTARTDSSREAENMGYFGTTLVQGNAVGVVIRTGDR